MYKALKFIFNHYPFTRGRHFIFRNLSSTGLLSKISRSSGDLVKCRKGFQLSCLKNDRVSDWLKVFGDYEKGTDAYFLSQHKAEGYFLDIGSNVGYYSLLHAKMGLVKGVWSFEPNPQPRKALEKSVRENNFQDQITVFPYALSDEEGVVNFHFEEGISGSGHISANSEDGIKVELKKFSDLWEKNGAPKVSIIKIDVEGHEWQVLQCMQEMLKRDHPKIVIELVNEQLERFGSSSKLITDYLENEGYCKVGGYELNSFFEYQS